MKRMSSFVLGMLMLLSIDAWALNLGKNLQKDEEENAEMEKVEKQLITIMDALRPANLLKASWVGENGKIGAEAEPKVFVENNAAYISYGVLVEVDREKYAKEVYEPLKPLLDKYAECVNEEFTVELFDKPFTVYLMKGPEIMSTLVLPPRYSPQDKNRIVYTLKPKMYNINFELSNKLRPSHRNYFILQAPTKSGMTLHVYSLTKNPKFHDALSNAMDYYTKNYGDTDLHVRAEDEDGIVQGNPQEINGNGKRTDVKRQRPGIGTRLHCINALTRERGSRDLPIFVHFMLETDGSYFVDPKQSNPRLAAPYSGDIYTLQQMFNGQLVVPKDDLENVKEIKCVFKSNKKN